MRPARMVARPESSVGQQRPCPEALACRGQDLPRMGEQKASGSPSVKYICISWIVGLVFAVMEKGLTIMMLRSKSALLGLQGSLEKAGRERERDTM